MCVKVPPARVGSGGGRSTNRGKARATTGVETFTLPNHPERPAVPQPFLGLNRIAAAERKTTVPVPQSPTNVLTVSAASLPAGFLDTPLLADDLDW